MVNPEGIAKQAHKEDLTLLKSIPDQDGNRQRNSGTSQSTKAGRYMAMKPGLVEGIVTR